MIHGYLGSSASLSKNLYFVQLFSKDWSRSIQVVSSAKLTDGRDASSHESIKRLSIHTPVAIKGLLRERSRQPENASNQSKKIRHLELDLLHVQPLNKFPSDINANPDNKFPPAQRHLQLRCDSDLKAALNLRARIGRIIRSKLEAFDFVEIETPLLFKSTPEGAREFIVPTRRSGLAYALPQSPQQFKQILMGSGIPKYYQFARCFRDEDLRTDRQPEFTQVRYAVYFDIVIVDHKQVDLEVSFEGSSQVMGYIENLIRSLWSEILAIDLPNPFPVMTYENAMSLYGCDKPDTRLGMQLSRLDHLLPVDLVSKITPLQNPIVEALHFRPDPDKALDPSAMRNFVSKLMESPDGLKNIKNPDGGPGVFVIDSAEPLLGLQALGFEAAEYVEDQFNVEDGDILFLQARQNRPFTGGSTALGNLRLTLHAAAVKGGYIRPPVGFAPLWVIDFPLFSPSSAAEPGQGGNAGLAATHHPFTSPKTSADVDLLGIDPTKAIGDHYDLVINGAELGGGSRRIHNAQMQEYVMRDILKMSAERLSEFSHLFEVLRAGCPPHAGIALGFDRLVAVMLGRTSVRDVIAFPKSGNGEDLLMKSPGPLNKATLETYHLQLRQLVAAEP